MIDLYDAALLEPRRDWTLPVLALALAVGTGSLSAWGWTLQGQWRQAEARNAALRAQIDRRPTQAAPAAAMLADLERRAQLMDARLVAHEPAAADTALRPSAWLQRRLQLYLDIEKVRFGHRLSTEISYNENCQTKLIPPMLLQPIVEKAIKFGLYDTTGIVTISIFGECTENELHITVQNPFDPDTSRPKHGTGFGLSGVKRRLHLLFGRTDLLETTSHSHIFTTIVKIPQQ